MLIGGALLEYVEPVEAGSAFDWSLAQCHSVHVLSFQAD